MTTLWLIVALGSFVLLAGYATSRPPMTPR
jgi:hypothetical protein